MTDLDPMVLAFTGILLYVLLSRSRPRVQAPPLLSSRTLAGIAIALAALFTPQPPPALDERKRMPTPPAVPAVAPLLAQEPQDAGADAAAPCGGEPAPAVPPTHSGAMLARDEPLYAAGAVLAVDHVEGR